MIEKLDYFLNRITMYRLIFYYLIGLILVAIILSLFHIFSFGVLPLIESLCFIVLSCVICNILFAKIFKAQTNLESVYISAFILTLIINPASSFHGFIILGWAVLWTITSKYLITIKRKLIFNPVAFGVFMTGIGLSSFASWWVGTIWMLPFVIIGGLLLIRKIGRESMVFTFLCMAIFTCAGITIMNGTDIFSAFQKTLFETPLFFFGFVMLTEPLTTPPTYSKRIFYAALIGILFAPDIHIANLYTSPEIALLIGNFYSFIVSPKIKLLLSLKQQTKVSEDIIDFIFHPSDQFTFKPGQYMEWTLSHSKADSRGNRRYFTLASSPTEQDVIVGIRINPHGSTFKSNLSKFNINDEIVAGQIAGDFVLPQNNTANIVLLAGGIGITPFRSMIKYLLDTNQKRNITLIYTAKTKNDFAYKQIFDEAVTKLGIQVIYIITQPDPTWNGISGRLNEQIIKELLPLTKDTLFYISGPNTMVNSYKHLLNKLNIHAHNIKTDYFPGFT